jgi:signal transduction histidine kinase
LWSRGTWTVEALPLWELYFAVTFGGVLLHSLALTQSTTRERLALAGVLLTILLLYVIIGRTAIKADYAGWRCYLFLLGVFVMFVLGTVLQGSTSFLLFALCPMTYMVLPLWPAHVAVVGFSLTPPAVFLAKTGDLRETATVLLPISLVAITVSVAMATTVSRTERLSAERATLIEELGSSRAEVARLSREAGIADERRRLAGDIHDTVAQGLSSVVMLIEAALVAEPVAARGHLELAVQTARENLEEARTIVAALTPTQLEGASLGEAMQRVADRFAADTDTATTFAMLGQTRTLPVPVEVVLLRVVQEALTNVRKHSGARSATVTLAFRPSDVVVEVTDDGCGFQKEASHNGYGLQAMRNRVDQIGGRLHVHSARHAGTTVRTEVDV